MSCRVSIFTLSVVLLHTQSSSGQTNIALHRPISAIGAVSGQPVLLANDGNSNTNWVHSQNTGWITVDLGSLSTVSTVRLLVEQTPAGLTEHVLAVAGENQVFSVAHTFNQYTQSNSWLTHTFSPALSHVRYVKITTNTSPSWVSWREIEILGQTAEATNCHACYFGYYWGAGEHPGMTGNYMSEFSDHSNIVHIVDSDYTRLAAKLAEARQRGMMAILAPQWQFFSAKGTLQPDYQAQWTTYADAVEPYIDDVLAIYPVDEPLWWADTCHHDVATRQVYETANAAIKARFPDKPIIVTFAYPCVTANLTIPGGYDWISFDQYGTFSTIPSYLDIIKSKLNGAQKIILTADGFVMGGVPAMETQYDWVQRARQYRTMALTNPQVIGLWTFIWPSFASGAGVRDLPPLKDEYRWIGQQMSGCKPPGAQACCVRAHCDDNNSATRDSCNVLTRQCFHTPIPVEAGVTPGDSGPPAQDSALPAADSIVSSDALLTIDARSPVGDARTSAVDGNPADGRTPARADGLPTGDQRTAHLEVSGGCGCSIRTKKTEVSPWLLPLMIITVWCSVCRRRCTHQRSP